MNPDDNASALRQGIWRIASREAPCLRFGRPPIKPKSGTRPWFPDADCFSMGDARYVELIYKTERCAVDLQFRSTSEEILRQRTKAILAEGMSIEPAKKSASIRITVPEIDFHGAAEDQEAQIIKGIAACESLRAFFAEHHMILLPQ